MLTAVDYAIDVRGLTKRYGANVASNEIDLRVKPGTTFGLLGPNGAGKSTLIRMLMGLTSSDSGEAYLLGIDVNQRSSDLRKRIGYVPELHFIYRWMTIGEVLGFVSSLYNHWDTELAESLISRFELPITKRVSALSKGMTAKLGLVLALSHRPDLLILDEPTSGLDPIIREDFLESVLRSHSGGNRTILFSSHHVDDVERVSDEVGIMVQGKLRVSGPPEELRSRIKRIRAVLRDGTLPKWTPEETLHQRISRREWTLTVDPFSIELIERLQSENDLVAVDIIDLNLEEIFKDLVRGSSLPRLEEAA